MPTYLWLLLSSIGCKRCYRVVVGCFFFFVDWCLMWLLQLLLVLLLLASVFVWLLCLGCDAVPSDSVLDILIVLDSYLAQRTCKSCHVSTSSVLTSWRLSQGPVDSRKRDRAAAKKDVCTVTRHRTHSSQCPDTDVHGLFHRLSFGKFHSFFFLIDHSLCNTTK